MKTCLWLLSLLLSGYGLLAQPFTARNLGLQQGLPEYYVSGLVQDKAGFVWVATRDGLARYDGRQFKVFRHQPFRSGSLAMNAILSLETVADTALLLHLESGAYQFFNPLTERFTDLFTTQQLAQSRLKLDKVVPLPGEKKVWSRSGIRLIEFDQPTRHFSTYPFPPLPNHAQVTYLGKGCVRDGQHRLYATVPGHLVAFNTRLKRFQWWADSGIGLPGQIETFYGTPMLRRANSEILIGGADQLILFNTRSHRFRSLPIAASVSTQVGLLYQGPDGQVFFTHAMTLYQLGLDDRIIPLWTAPRIDYQNYFRSLLLDRTGVLWIGTNGDGIYQIDTRALPIKTYPYKSSFLHDVLAHEWGLAVPEWAKTARHVYTARLGGTAPQLTLSVNDLYFSLQGDPGRHTMRPVLNLPPTQNLAGIEGGNGLRVMTDGTVWCYDPHRGLLKTDSAGRLLDTFRCSVNWVTDVQPLGDWVWLASEENGLYAYDLKRRRMVRHLHYQPADSTALPSDRVLCLAADPTHPAVLWVGTQEGLCRLDTRTGRSRNWTQRQGLPSATINTLLADRGGNLWYSSYKGISRMNPRTGQLRHFTTADGLLDIEYRHNHAARLPDGRLAFGGATGMTVFNPLALEDIPQAIPTVLTGLRLGNVPIEPGRPGSPLRVPLNATSRLQLLPDQNFLSLEFAGLQYNKPTSLQYRYQLRGVDDHWVYVGNQTVANYTQLAPGHYEFRVNSADALGNWSRLVKTLPIEIASPWWATGWFYGLVTAVSLATLYGLYRYRLAQVLKLQQLRNGIARDLHDEIGSSISTIAIYAKLVLQQVEDAPLRSGPLLMKITEQATDIMGSMSDIVWSINTKNDALEQVFIRMREHAFELLEAKGYTIHFAFDQQLHHTKLAMEKRRDVYLIYKEALNNIAKYAGGQNVWISVQLRNTAIDLLIRDDGGGFDLNPVRSQGNGLANMRYRANALKGTLHINSAPGQGTTLQLTF